MTEASAIPLDAEPDFEGVETHPGDEASPPSAQPLPKTDTNEGDERLKALNRIARRNHEQDIGTETPPAISTTDTGGSPSGDSQEPPTPESPTDAGKKGENTRTDPMPSDEQVAVTIDGRTKMVPLKTVIKGYQIESAARKRLGEAAVLYKRLRQREMTLTPPGNPPHTQTPGPTPLPGQPADPGSDPPSHQEMQNYLEQVEPETPAATTMAPVNPEQLAEYVFLRQEVRGEKQRLVDTQPHIARDAKLSGMHAQMVMEAMETQPGLPTRDYFDHATEAINQWLVQLTTAKLTRSSDPGQRLMDKRTATSKQAPSGIHRKVPSGTDSPSPPTYADKIRQMKQARGLT